MTQHDHTQPGQSLSPDEALRHQQWETFDKWMESTITERRRSRRWKVFFRLLFLAFLIGSLANTVYFLHFASSGDAKATERHLGIVDVDGVIDAEQRANASRINAGLRRAMENEYTDAVILRINSPGGSPVQAQRIYREVQHLIREYPDKPLISWIEDIGASGAYYIAAATQEIHAAPASLVGSIGVIHAGFGFADVLQELGIERRLFTAGENKAFLDPFSDVPAEQRSFWESVLTTTHQQFINDVVTGRGERLLHKDEVFSGLVWTGEQAINLGLVDRISTLEELSRELIGDIKLQNYTPRLSAFDRLAQRISPAIQRILGLPTSQAPAQYLMQ